ncbi:hypothetical protein [Luteibacter sp. 22Crub2.1]|uniref:hypothetical protein n=1 Tax=Luteibacter sp. 22Crub2.1 TaxID=1283288 RepID=UPI0009A73902|nr:hypothetical protein [Luteibacter sp. 22Crub2.1]SKB56961.1 hypothetical protein SAMN05660880_01682 [Luteibacter sp. 22Crub2.1]
MAVFAAQVTPPGAPEPTGKRAVAVDAGHLDAYTGFYKLSDYSLLTVERKGNGLTISPIGQFLAQGTIDVSAQSDTEFLVPSIDVTLEFVKGPEKQAASVNISEHGVLAIQATRVDRVTADRIRDALAARVKEQKPFPNSENALHLVLTNSASEKGMSPLWAKNFASQHDSIEKYYAALGPVQSYRFEGVTDYGWDIYDVQYERGAQQIFIQLDKDGMLVSSVMRRQ